MTSASTSDEDGSTDDAFSVHDEWNDIVVGYAFGPKKMSTMGMVMAEASRTRLITTSAEAVKRVFHHKLEQQEQPLQQPTRVTPEPSLTVDTLRDYHAPTSSCSADMEATSSPSSPLHRQAQPPNNTNQIEILLDAGHDLRKVVRRLRSSSSSVASSSVTTSTSTGTRTASTVISHITSSGVPAAAMTGGCTTSTNTNSTNHNTATMRTSTAATGPSHSLAIPVRVSFVPLDPEIPLEEQHGGRMDVILHKLTEDILLSSQWEQKQNREPDGQEKNDGSQSIVQTTPLDAPQAAMAARRRIQRLADFSVRHGCPLVDHPYHVQRLMNRSHIAATLATCLNGVVSATGRPVGAPPYAVLSEASKADKIRDILQQAQLKFPIIVKPLTAAGTKASHAMAVLLSMDNLDEQQEQSISDLIAMPSLCQEYVNHNAWLYKVYVLGDYCSVHKRRSLPNLPNPSHECSSTKIMVAFDSQRPYPRLRDFGYDVSGTETLLPAINETSPVTADEVQPIVQALKSAFHLELFGFDVICATDSDTLMVVDVNYFPSYKEVPNFAALLAKYLTDRALEKRSTQVSLGKDTRRLSNSPGQRETNDALHGKEEKCI